MMQTMKPWEGRLAEVEEQRSRKRPPKLRIIVSEPGKGRPPLRQCPPDFDVIFVEIGRVDCEAWYRARRTTIDRWLSERGKVRLIQLRADYVKHLRLQLRKPKPGIVIHVATDSRVVSPELAQLAADYLRISRNGGWRVSATGQGDWWVGQYRRSPGAMLAMAIKCGFDLQRANLQAMAMRGVKI